MISAGHGRSRTAAGEQAGAAARATDRWHRLDWPGLLVGAAGLGGLSLLLLERFSAPGAEMDEGSVLAYANRVMHGAIPWRTFQTFYGPANLWFVGLADSVFGVGVDTERGVGLVYRLLIALGLFLLVRRIGLAAGAGALAICVLLLPAQGSAAIALYGALGLALMGTGLLGAAVCRPRGRVQGRLACAAGVALGISLLVRFDFVLAAVLPASVLARLLPRSALRRMLGGAILALSAYIPQLVLVGPSGLARLAQQLMASEPGRRLPLPALQTYPGMLLWPSMLATLLLIAVGGLVVSRRRGAVQYRLLLAGGLLSAGVLPTTLSRADGWHVVPGSLVSLALLPGLITVLVRELAPTSVGRVLPRRVAPALLAVTIGVLALVDIGGLGPLQATLGLPIARAWPVSLDGRSFPVGSRFEAEDVQSIIDTLAQRAKPDQSLFVGPVDLRQTNYNDTYIYYLLPKLKPASFYMELNPETANRPGSGLAQQLARADWLILTTRYDVALKPNASRALGSPLPSEVVKHDFCLQARRGNYFLLSRCHEQDGTRGALSEHPSS